MRRAILFVGLSALCLVLLPSMVTAQKKPKPTPPTYQWSVVLPTDGSSSIYGPANASGGAVPFVDGQESVSVSAGVGTCADCIFSGFSLSLGAPMDLPTDPWVGFRYLDKYGPPDYNDPWGDDLSPFPCRYPAFNDEGVILPGTYATTPDDNSCLLDFLSHRHPQYPYNRLNLDIQVRGLDAMNMGVGSSFQASAGRILLQVLGPDCNTSEQYSGVYFQLPFLAGGISVTRTAEDEWAVDLHAQPLYVYEAVQEVIRGHRCGTSGAGYVGSPGIDGHLVWSRRLVSQ